MNPFDDEQKQEIKPYTLDDYSLIIVLGKGSYGKVVLVKNKDDKKIYAMKILKKQQIESENQVFNERNVLVSVQHPFIIRLQQSFQTNDKLYFVMEYCPGGELYNLLKKKKRFNEDQTRFYVSQILLALEALHQQNIIYRDLKPENVLIDIDGYLRIADFGLSKSNIQDDTSGNTICGTPEYFSPEILKQQGHGKPVDWWSFGCLIYEMITGLPPFIQHDKNKLFQKILDEDIPPIPNNIQVSSFCKDLIQKLLIKNPKERLGSKGAQQIKQHPWFKHVSWEHLIDKMYAPPFTPLIKSDVDVRNFDREFTELKISSQSKTPQSQINGKYYLGFSYMGSKQEESQMNSNMDSNIDEDEDDDDEEEDEDGDEEEENDGEDKNQEQEEVNQVNQGGGEIINNNNYNNNINNYNNIKNQNNYKDTQQNNSSLNNKNNGVESKNNSLNQNNNNYNSLYREQVDSSDEDENICQPKSVEQIQQLQNKQ